MIIHGIAFGHSETGTEGMWWAVQDKEYMSLDEKSWDYTGLHILKKGDKLTLHKDSKVIWEGTIDPDYEVGVTNSPASSIRQQQSACGFWVHWIQRGWRPDAWARLFLDEPRATLEKLISD